METRLTKYQDVEDAVIIDQPEEKKAFILGNTRGIELQYLVEIMSRQSVITTLLIQYLMPPRLFIKGSSFWSLT